MSTVTLIDLSGIFWAAWHATADKPIGEAYSITISAINRWHTEHCAICLDAPPYFRKELSQDYKAQRDAPEPDALDQFRRVKERLAADGNVMWECRGFEADDVIATATVWLRDQGHDVVIVSGDKDMLQLVGDHVIQRKPSTGDTFDVAAVVSKFGVHPNQMRDLLALMGDSSDNVPGVPGIGAKTAASLLKDFGDIDNLLENLQRLLEKSKVRASLTDHAEDLRLSRQLVTLRTDVPLDFNELFREREAKPLKKANIMSDQDLDAEDNMDDPSDEIAPAPTTETKRDETPKPKPDALAVHQNGNGNGTAISPVSFEQGLQPGSIGAAYKLATGLAQSRLYSRFPNAEAIWAVIIRGREMGLGALTALDSFHIIEGKPAPSAHLLIARAKSHPDCEFLQYVGGDATFAEYETKNRRSPRPTRLKYTIEQARRAGLVKQGSNWEKRPEEMLRKTVALQLVRIEYPEVLQGTYAAEELEGTG